MGLTLRHENYGCCPTRTVRNPQDCGGLLLLLPLQITMATAERVSPAVNLAAVNGQLSRASAEERIDLGGRGVPRHPGADLQLRRAGRGHAGAGDAGRAGHSRRLRRHRLHLPRDLPLHRRADGQAEAQSPESIAAALSPAWLEARHGKLWEQGVEGLEAYNRIAKVEPMQRALQETGRQGVAGRASAAARPAPAKDLEVVGHAGRADRSPPDRRLDGPRRAPLPPGPTAWATIRCGSRATSRSATCRPPGP